MNKGMFFGWKSVCSFTYTQTMKSKAMKVTLAILMAIAILSMPVMTLLSSGADEDVATKIEKAYIFSNYDYLNEKLSGMDFAETDYENVSLELIEQEQKENIVAQLKEDEETADVLVEILYDNAPESMDYGIEVKLIYNDNGIVDENDANEFAGAVAEKIDEIVLKASDMEEHLLANLLKANEYELHTVDAAGTVETKEEGLNSAEYGVTYGYLMVVMFAIMIAGSKVAELIVTEKTSKVMEYLLTSVKPLALLIGKVVSTMLIVFTAILGVGAGLLVSAVFNHVINETEGILPETLVNLMESGVLKGFNPLNIVIAIAFVLLGFLFYSLLAGLAGATVGKVEELAEGLKLFTFTLVVGVYLVLALVMIAATGSEPEMFANIVYYLPLSSIFVIPAYLVLGKVSLVTALISLGILAVATVIMWYFVTKVFEHVLYNNGNVMKFKDILAVYKMNAGKEKAEVRDGK